jgi:toxin ParE1/3/4
VFKVVWTDSAIADLNDIGQYFAKDSERYGRITVSKLFYSTDILETFPIPQKAVLEFNNESIQ